MTLGIWMPYYAHARFNNLDLDARSQWVSKRVYGLTMTVCTYLLCMFHPSHIHLLSYSVPDIDTVSPSIRVDNLELFMTLQDLNSIKLCLTLQACSHSPFTVPVPSNYSRLSRQYQQETRWCQLLQILGSCPL